MHRNEVGSIAFALILQLLEAREISIPHVGFLLAQKQVQKADIPPFERELQQQNGWWPRRCAELALTTIVAAIEQSSHRLPAILEALAIAQPSRKLRQLFVWNITHRVGTQRHTPDTALEL